MNMQEVRDRATTVGLVGVGKLRKVDLIRKIQETEGNHACYGAEWRQSCAEILCCWRSDCLKE